MAVLSRNLQATSVIACGDVSTEHDKYTACVVSLRGEGTGKMIRLSQELLVIGRSEGADLPLNSAGVSRRHAQIERESEQQFRLRDLGSTNGTFVNAARIDCVVLKDQDVIAIGESRFKFLAANSSEQPFYEALYSQVQLDQALQIFNKNYFLTRLDAELQRHCSLASPLALILFDVDHFKLFNDAHGHLAGDAALVHLVLLVKGCIRHSDILCRYGGEEFALILPHSPPERAQELAEQLRRVVASTAVKYANQLIPMTISLGVSQLNLGVTIPKNLILEADRALYAAKHGGRNQVAHYHLDMAEDGQR